jgi:RHH-type proline utilization regulon transcriptional repressor/proline dehydrogenase/delta 1-pyrroline-5-carboxylate dehydrogenase
MHKIRTKIRNTKNQCERAALVALLKEQPVVKSLRDRISDRAVELVERIRIDSHPSIMELFLSEYGLSSEEGVALMCLAEALLRVPDGATMDALIEDKIAPSKWGQHLGQSHSSLINASTWALFMTGKVLSDDKSEGVSGILRGAIKRLGEPIVRQAVTRVMKELGKQFVLGETVQAATKRAQSTEAQGFTYSYDMLGEAARTESDARKYYLSYTDAIGHIAKVSASKDIRENPGISIKLSALHPRYETLQKKRVMQELMPRARSLAILAKSAGIGLNIDAEEAGRLDLSLDIIEAILSEPALEGWDGFGVVVQAYGLRAPAVIDWLYALAKAHDRKIMIRLVKGAYWDTEIKHAQVEGHDQFPVFTQKSATDVSFICCAQKLLGMTDRLYPQFATHNAHTVAAILEMADDKQAFEFQRLHGMGEALHDTVLRRQSTRCRIYAPVGAHKDLLAYLVRRLLENGANSSFVNQIVDETVPPEIVAADPFIDVLARMASPQNPNIRQPSDLFSPARKNSKGWDLEDQTTLDTLETVIAHFDAQKWSAGSGTEKKVDVINPATQTTIGSVYFSTISETKAVLKTLVPWDGTTPQDRAKVLRRVADLYEQNYSEIFALLMAEAGKTVLDCVGELREAVDFLRYYADQAEEMDAEPAGIFACISPWNFPLAIFTGQISAALATGNAVIAKPAETTGLIADLAVRLMKEAGVPDTVLQLVFGTGAEVGNTIVSNPAVNGVCFTGSTAAAQHINRSMANNLAPHAPLIAETGGLNAMIVDSTALPEQAIGDIIASAFQSAGQRCSALRVLYLQEDIAEQFMEMLFGAMEELSIGEPRNFSTDIGPVIDEAARASIASYIDEAHAQGRVLKQLESPNTGTFIGPCAVKVSGIEDLTAEVFGPVLHIATYSEDQMGKVIDQINATGYGLTFGMHSRIDERVQFAIDRIEAGNVYINRNQIGAVVGSQPFGGEGMSGTGPKAGGPKYLRRFVKTTPVQHKSIAGDILTPATVNAAFSALEASIQPNDVRTGRTKELPGPTGESNQYLQKPRGRVLCLGPTVEDAEYQAQQARVRGSIALAIAPKNKIGLDGILPPSHLSEIENLEAVVSWSLEIGELRKALASLDGPIVPLLSEKTFSEWLLMERHICVDTTAAGGNAALLAG